MSMKVIDGVLSTTCLIDPLPKTFCHRQMESKKKISSIEPLKSMEILLPLNLVSSLNIINIK